jgi:2-methylcitrate dehydratase PrpD
MSDAWTATIAEWAAGLAYDDLPSEVVHHAKRSILDHVAVAVAGSGTAPARAVRSYLDDLGGAGPSTVWGAARSASPPDAALANGTAAHALEADDGYTPGSYHPGAPVLSAVLAVAQARGCSAQELIRASAVAYEVSCRLAEAGHPATWRRGFHNTALVGVFGAAVGTAALLGADAPQLASTLGLAASHASGLFAFLSDGADSKRLHAGKAARDAAYQAMLAGHTHYTPAAGIIDCMPRVGTDVDQHLLNQRCIRQHLGCVW